MSNKEVTNQLQNLEINNSKETKDTKEPKDSNNKPIYSEGILQIKNSKEKDFLLFENDDIIYKTYSGENIIDKVMDIMSQELSEPYPIFTYRYFLNGWPDLNIMVFDKKKEKFIGCIIGKCDRNKKGKMKGYIAMIAVDKEYRGKRIGKFIGEVFISQCRNLYNADEIELETEVTNIAALNLYGGLGFVRTKILYNYYLNNNNAYKLKLWFVDYAKKEEK